MFHFCWVIIRPYIEMIQSISYITMHLGSQNALWYMIYFGSVLYKAWWWLSTVETCYHEIILYDRWCVWLKHTYCMSYVACWIVYVYGSCFIRLLFVSNCLHFLILFVPLSTFSEEKKIIWKVGFRLWTIWEAEMWEK